MFIMTKQGWKPLSPVSPSKKKTYEPCQSLKDLGVYLNTAFETHDKKLQHFANNVLKMSHKI